MRLDGSSATEIATSPEKRQLVFVNETGCEAYPDWQAISSEFGTKNSAEGVRIPGIVAGAANHASQRARIAKTRGPQEFDGNGIRGQAVHDDRLARGARKKSMKQRARCG